MPAVETTHTSTYIIWYFIEEQIQIVAVYFARQHLHEIYVVVGDLVVHVVEFGQREACDSRVREQGVDWGCFAEIGHQNGKETQDRVDHLLVLGSAEHVDQSF